MKINSFERFFDQKNFSKAVRDPLWQHIWFTPELYALTQTEDFLRLYAIKQLGPTELVYPGASHTRAVHSIGVYHVAKRMVQSLLKNNSLHWITPEGLCSFLAAALLHDLGHFPFTHSLKELRLKEHEQLTAESILRDPLQTLVEKAGADPKQTAAIIDDTLPANNETGFFRNLLSGVLDPDKLDYLNRDAYYCGVPYGVQDIDFIFSELRADQKNGLCITEKAIMSVENILFSKYLMYKAVYWHKDVRIATAMMKKMIYAGLRQSIFSPESLYHQDDKGIFSLIDKTNFPEKTLAYMMKSGKLFEQVAEVSFDPQNMRHKALEDLDFRAKAEEEIADFLGAKYKLSLEAKDVLIDIPEKISFESLLKTENGDNFVTVSVFDHATIEKFVSSLRKIRIALLPDAVKKIGKLPLEMLEQWI
ncbi:HD domain-containing protein [Treponema phagedenis]|uniref:HD domain-containing protein n=2 Tax=Treponema phagedenis TaxID=162 RepID=A0A0B7H226_TREPH|nr:HD domain-containing protein [Treponema phagedenis]EFW36712.1 hypothetical protein HMPREF9554_02829 [Treponema phagedenis F0421]NVP24143.1 HD domain-containing protein [Treponema phagedenis]QEJ96297.1 HD domain-containing protein [Treponema phagedenis]QEJ99295.1 HD domain-containing protein [Treponema phagedenis]QEK00074.1 HD domain-containing protein [Treponema phagedenis]